MSKKHGCLLIGAGKAGVNFIEASELVAELPIVGVADPDLTNREAARRRLGEKVRATTEYRELLKDEQVESVLIATPNYLHERHAVDALGAGKHVLVEKPMAISLESCDRMIQARQQSGKHLQVGLELRHSPSVRQLKGLIDAGNIGPVHMMWHNTFRPPFLKKVNDWVVKTEKSGGAIVEKLVHQFDLFNWVAGSPPKQVVAFGGADAVYKEDWEGVQPDVIDNAWILVEYENNIRACMGVCFFSQGVQQAEFGVIGREGRLDCFDRQHRVEFIDRQDNHRASYQENVPEHIRKVAHGGPGYYQALHWLEVLESRTAVTPTAEEGRAAVAVALAAERSIRSGKIENVVL